jgi:phage-related minor tail protein
MAAEYPLSLIIKAVDKATAPLRQINARLQKFTAPVRKLNSSFRALADEAGLPRLVKGFSGVGRAIGNVGSEALALGTKISAMAAGAAFALYGIVKSAVDAGDKLGEMAARVGLSVDAYAQLEHAAGQADVETEAFAGAMDQFNKRLGEAKAGTGSLLTFLEKVSPALARQVKGANSTEEALALMADAFEKVKDPAKRAALSNAAFGRSGLQMGQFLGQGNKAIGEQRKRFAELAGSQEAFARGAGELDNAMRETRTAFRGLGAAASGELFPALTELARAITGILAGNRGRLAAWAREAGAAISEWVKGGGLDRVIDAMKRWAAIIGRVFDAVGGLKGVLAILGVYLASSFIASVGAAVASLWTLGAAAIPMVIQAGALLLPVLGQILASFIALNLANPIVWIVAGVAALGAAAYLIWKHWEPIKIFFEELWGTIKGIFGVSGGVTGGGGRVLGAAGAAPAPLTARGAEGHVKVDFENLPRGARVTADPKSTAPLDLSMGYSMASSH